MPSTLPCLRRAVLVGSLLLAGCGGSKSTPPPPPPPPTEIAASGNAYQVIAAGSYSTTGFNLHVPALGPDERLALLVTNVGTTSTNVTLTASATSSAVGRFEGPAVAARMASGTDTADDRLLAAREPLLRGHELARRRVEDFMGRAAAADATMASHVTAPLPALQVAAAAAVGDQRNFHVYSYTNSLTSSLPATLRYVSSDGLGGSHAQFWVTDDVWPSLQTYVLPVRSDYFDVLGNAYEARILPALGAYFGQESDVDGNGQMIFLLANLGMDPTSGGFPVGYFYPPDVYCLTAGDPACGGVFSNKADMLYLLDPVTFAQNWGGTLPASMPPDPVRDATWMTLMDEIVDGETPSTMAHELQHDVNFNTRCLADRARCFAALPPPNCPSDPYRQQESTWVNEGLSMVSEDVAGYGLNTSTERSRVRRYLGCSVEGASAPSGCAASTGSTFYGYQNWSLTCWEADPIGNYGGAHAYMRYWLDQQGSGFTKAMLNTATYGKASVEQATGMAFDAGFARFAAASLVSNEDTARYPAGGTDGGTISSLGGVLSEQTFNYGTFLPGGVLDPIQPPWAPWHHYTGSCTIAGTSTIVDKLRTARVKYTAFDPASPVGSTRIRSDGWGAFVTRGTGADATIQFRPSGSVRPSVALVRYSGGLPDASFDAVNCP